MKKFLILLLATLAFPFAQAQEFHFMPKVGMSFANLTNSEGKMAPGLNIGVAAEFPVFDSFSIEPGVYYSMQGTRSSSYVGMGDMRVGGDVTFDMDYINIPIYAKYYVYEGFHLFAGPQFGFYLGDKGHKGGLFNDSTLNLRPGLVNQQYDLPVKNKFEYGITAGLGIEVNTRHAGHFLLEGRYYYGLSDVFGNSKKDVFGRSANGTIAIRATYLFDLIKTKKRPKNE